ncbi:MAG TPA: C4-type zinc ribbon domain-containing protein [Streptosporangiaceae bacterium]|nr:C4-type zinc ribbon domain-containing protein [Streptosporangiaceae bacterium]
MKASPQSQLRLLELADLDAELARLDHRRRNLPEAAELARLEARAGELRDGLVVTETELGDLGREQTRAERDVDQVRTRIDRDRARLDAGQVSAARELATLQSEIESLRRRQGDLEEIVLELMERREGLVSRQDELSAERDRLGIETAEMTARRDAAVKEIDEQTAKASDQRAGVAAEVPADLLKLYEQIRDSRGVGAAALRAGRCEGCHLTMNTVDLNQIRASAPDEVIRCEECRRILVRTPESGL